MRARAVLLLLVLPTGIAAHLSAQTPAPSFQSLEYRPDPFAFSRSCSSIIPSRGCRGQEQLARAPDHRYEGMALGAAIGAGLGVLLGLWVCEQADDDGSCAGEVVAGGGGGALLLGFVGLMIGAQFSKEEEPAP